MIRATRVQAGMVMYVDEETRKTGSTTIADFCRLEDQGVATTPWARRAELEEATGR